MPFQFDNRYLDMMKQKWSLTLTKRSGCLYRHSIASDKKPSLLTWCWSLVTESSGEFLAKALQLRFTMSCYSSLLYTSSLLSFEWNSIRLCGPAHGMVTETVHKTLPGSGGGKGGMGVGGWGLQGWWVKDLNFTN